MIEKTIKNWLKKIKLNESAISTILGGLVVMVVGILIFNYFKTGKTGEIALEKPEENHEVSFTKTKEGTIPENLPDIHKVKQNESLWKISEQYYTSGYNWVDIAKENKLVNPNHLEDGQELKLPKIAIKKPSQETQTENQNLKTPEEKIKSEAITGNSYKITKGDNLWKIAVRAYGDGYKWLDIAKANNLINPDYIEVNQELNLPR